ncbi:type IV pilin protein [Pseudobowmanella zhangzhouensis]|uniref:type IV pilin protein n=1 Tax=Pseudobowmanella zhangzhouensis TaxID=1537679 RepID=UPI003620DC81
MKQQGFSLIELMVAVAIVGILVVIAVPSYQDHVRSANRAAAQADLMALAAAMEQHKSVNYSYAGAAEGGGDTGTLLYLRDIHRLRKMLPIKCTT